MNIINGTDTGFMMVATVLVMLMTPGLALFYGGMVKRKNVLNTTMHSYAAIIIVSLQWILIGYTLVFGKDIFGIIGDFRWLGLNGVGYAPNPEYATTIPQQSFMIFQLMFAIITPALISGAFAERMKMGAFILFVILWSTFVYDPIAHWVWGNGGWLHRLGALDFAGGNVVHITSGVSGLVACIAIGKRKFIDKHEPHNIPMTILGAGILWFGWFGFNAGSALALNNIALNSFITTNTSAAAAAAAWVVCEWIIKKKVSILGMVSGIIAGLVAITPAAGFVTPLSAIFIGGIGGAICFYSVNFMKKKFGYDDALDAFGCHGVGGTWGAIATGIFASKAVNSSGANGLLHGNIKLVGVQLLSVGVTYAYTIIATLIILKIISLLIPLRVNAKEEYNGLDISLHGEMAYSHMDIEYAGESLIS